MHAGVLYSDSAQDTPMRIELITPESGPSRMLRKWRLIQFPQLTMPLIAAHTPPHVDLHHTDEVVEPVDLDRDADLVAITCNTPAANHVYRLADAQRERGRRVVLGGPHVSALPHEALRHADAIVIGEGEMVWPQVIEDFERGRWSAIYRGRPADLRGMPAPRWDLIRGRGYGRAVTIATRGCVHQCGFTQMYRQGRLLTTDWDRYNGKVDAVFRPAQMSARELEQGVAWFAGHFYSAASILDRLVLKSRVGLW